jgi:hypothetical protein
MRALAWALVAVLLAGAVYRGVTYKKRRGDAELEEWSVGGDRYVNLGVELRVVVQDPKGDRLIRGKPKLCVVATHFAGGLYDTRTKTLGPIERKRRHVWYASPAQAEIILHPDGDPLGQLIYGSEGGGKTETLPMWHFWRWLEHLGEGRYGGQLAPTVARLDVFLKAFRKRFPKAWYRYRSSKRLIQLCDGSSIELVSTHKQSEEQGSPVQGYGWSWCGMDEAQDSIKRWDDVENRGREAPERDGTAWFKQARTATAKDHSDWRSARDQLLTAESGGRKLWCKRTLLGVDSPFIPPKFWEDKRASMSSREFQRRILAQDLPPELAVYYGWSRERNVVPLPQIARDVTASVLAGYRSAIYRGAALGLLGGHDPGIIYNTSEVLRLVMFGDVPTWVVVGELQTKQTTEREHAAELAKFAAERFYVNHPKIEGPKLLCFVDPHGKSEGQSDYQTHYMPIQAAGIDTANPTPMVGRIKKTARVEMLNRLFETGRLVVACDHNRQPVAPVLVKALESLQKRIGEDNPDGERRKDESDQTHAPAALAYALWPFEQEAFTLATQRTAIAEARRRRA